MRRWGATWGKAVGLVSIVMALAAGCVGWLATRYANHLRADYPTPPPERTVYFDSDTYTVTEGGTITITVLLSSPADETVTVNYEVADEYGDVLASGTISFAPGETSCTYTDTAPDDRCPNPDVMVTLRLSNPQGGNTGLGDPSTATVTVVDNDTVCEQCAEAGSS